MERLPGERGLYRATSRGSPVPASAYSGRPSPLRVERHVRAAPFGTWWRRGALLVRDEREDVVVVQALAAAEGAQLDEEGEGVHVGAEELDELGGSHRGAACGEQVVHDHRPLVRFEGALADIELAGAVLQRVFDRHPVCGK